TIEEIIRSPAVDFVPAVGGLSAETDTHFERWPYANSILHVKRAFQRAPTQWRLARSVGVSAHFALQKTLQIGERNLTILILNQGVIGLDALQPRTKCQ